MTTTPKQRLLRIVCAATLALSLVPAVALADTTAIAATPIRPAAPTEPAADIEINPEVISNDDAAVAETSEDDAPQLPDNYMYTLETSVPEEKEEGILPLFSFLRFFASTPGVNGVKLTDTNAKNWIDRIDYSGYEFTRNLYDMFILASTPTNTSVTLSDGVTQKQGTGYLINSSNFGNIGKTNYTSANVGTICLSNAGVPALLLAKYPTSNSGYNADTVRQYFIETYGAFDRDHPEFFWRGKLFAINNWDNERDGNTYWFFSLCSSTYSVVAVDYRTYTDSTKTLRQFNGPNSVDTAKINSHISVRNSKIAEQIGAVNSLTKIEDKVAYFDNWICATNRYAPIMSETTSMLPWLGISALLGSDNTTPATEGPVCEGYSRALKMLCDKAGIDCVLADGTAGKNGGPHMWNYVKIGDAWYAVDSTWNDIGPKSSKEYLLVGSSTFSEMHVENNIFMDSGNSFVNGPKLSVKAYADEDASKATPKYTTPSAIESFYGKQLNQIALPTYDSDTATQTAGSWQWAEPTFVLKTIGTQSYGIVFVPKDTTTYKTVKTTLSVTVKQKTITDPIIELPTNFDYSWNNGSAITPTPVLKDPDSNIVIPASEYTVGYNNNVNVGTANCIITNKTGGNYIVSGTTNFTITKRAQADFAINSVTLEYGTPATITATGIVSDGGATPSITWSATPVGSYTIGANDSNGYTITPTGVASITVYASIPATNHYRAAEISRTFSVNQKQLTVTGTTVAAKTYDASTSVATSLITGSTVTGLVAGDVVSAIPSSATLNDKNVGNRKATIQFNLTGPKASCYKASPVEADVVVKKASIADCATYTVANQRIRIGATPANATVSSTATAKFGTTTENVNGTVTWENTEAFAGSDGDKVKRNWTFTPTDANYEGTLTGETEFTLTTVLTPTLAVSDYTKVYDGTEATLATTDFAASAKGTDGNALEGTWELSGTTKVKDAGSYTTTLTFKPTSADYESTSITASTTVTPRPTKVSLGFVSNRFASNEDAPTPQLAFDNGCPAGNDVLTPELKMVVEGIPTEADLKSDPNKPDSPLSVTRTVTWKNQEEIIKAIEALAVAKNYTLSAGGTTAEITLTSTSVIPSNNDSVRVETINGLPDVPTSLQGTEFSTQKTIVSELLRVAGENMKGVEAKQTLVYDLALYIEVDGKWVAADASNESNFPKEGVTVSMRYPSNTSGVTHNFTVAHMFTANVNGFKPGDTEAPTVTLDNDTISFKLMGFSPVTLSYATVETSSIVNPNSIIRMGATLDNYNAYVSTLGTTGGGTTTQTGINSNAGLSATGDNVFVIGVVCVVVAGAIAYTIFARKKRNQRRFK